MTDLFRLSELQPDKRLEIEGPCEGRDAFLIWLEYDDNDWYTADLRAEKMISILNRHWDDWDD